METAEDMATEEALSSLPPQLSWRLRSLLEEFQSEHTPEGTVARDSDILECLIQAREYSALGVTAAKEFAAPLATPQNENGA